MTTTRLGAARLVASLGVWLLAAPALAQQPSPSPSPEPDAFRGYVRVGGTLFDNFFEATEGLPEESVTAGTLGGGMSFRLSEGSPLQARLSAEYVLYSDGFDPSSSFAAGLGSDGRPHSWDLSVRYLRGRPGRELGDTFDRANSLGVFAEYGYRIIEDVELIGLAQFRRETYDLLPDRTLDGYAVGAAVRYRGFGRRFSPEVGGTLGGRSVSEPGEDLSQREAWVRVRWTPISPLYLSARYRYRDRSYSIEDLTARNFGREDTRNQLVLSGDWTMGSIVWNLYYTREDSNSSLPTGTFDTQSLTLGVTYQF